MKIVKQNHEIISDTNPMKHIEKIARVCYKSEDKICDGSDKRMIATLFKNGHMAMLEHFRLDRKSTRLNSSHYQQSRMPSSA